MSSAATDLTERKKIKEKRKCYGKKDARKSLNVEHSQQPFFFVKNVRLHTNPWDYRLFFLLFLVY